MQVQNLSTQLGRTESAFDSEHRAAAASAHLAGPSSGCNADASITAPRLFSPRKSLVPFTAANAGEVVAAGANWLVAGSAVFKGGKSAYAPNIAAIRAAALSARGEMV